MMYAPTFYTLKRSVVSIKKKVWDGQDIQGGHSLLPADMKSVDIIYTSSICNRKENARLALLACPC